MSPRMLYQAVLYYIHERALRYRAMAVTYRRVLLAHGPCYGVTAPAEMVADIVKPPP
jgi:hypothetical protein